MTFTPYVPGMAVTLKIYNSAGEVVVVLADQLNVPQGVSGLSVSGDVLVPDLAGSSATLVLLGGNLKLSWDGTNSGGQKVQSGTYTAKAEVMDSYGVVHTYAADISVLRDPIYVQVSVYNSAGELVREIRQASATVPKMEDLSFSSDQLVLGGGSQASLDVLYDGGKGKISWDGSNNQGRQVSAGMYILKVEASQPGQPNFISSKQVQVLVLPSASPLAGAFAAPNPARAGAPEVVIFLPNASPGLEIRAKIYGLSGELMASADNLGHFDRISWSLGTRPYSAGVYLAVLESQAGPLQRKTIKLVLER